MSRSKMVFVFRLILFYDLTVFYTALGKADIQRNLAEDEDSLQVPFGLSAWISLGLKHEEDQ